MNMQSEVDEKLNKFFENLDKNYVKVSEILSQLDLSTLYPNNNNKAEQFFKLYIYRGIKGITTFLTLIKSLDEMQTLQLGFCKDENNQLQLPSKRVYNKFMQEHVTLELKSQLNSIVEKILSLATQNNVLLDIEIVKHTINKNKISIDKEFREAVKVAKKLFYPIVDLKIGKNATFTTKDILNILIYVGYTNHFANDGCAVFKDENPNIKVPNGDTLMYHFGKLSDMDDVLKISDKLLNVVLTFGKRNYCLLKRNKLRIAFDLHYISYYGDPNDSYVVESKYERGTTHFYCFLTCSTIVAGKRFILDVIPKSSFDSVENLLDEMIDRVKKKVRIDFACLDRGFNRVKVIQVLNKHKVKYIMPLIKWDNIKEWFDKIEGIPAKKIKNFEIGSKEKVTTNLYFVSPEKDEDKIQDKVVFISNLDIPEMLAFKLFSMYGKRWGIETSYRQLDNDLLPRTTSKNFVIRLFYFIFSVCLFNLWILVKIIVSLNVYGRIKDNLHITLKRFIVVLYKIYIDPGG